MLLCRMHVPHSSCGRPLSSEILRHLCELAHNYALAGDRSWGFIASIEVLISQVLQHSSKVWPILIPQELVEDHSCGLEVDQFEGRLGSECLLHHTPPHYTPATLPLEVATICWPDTRDMMVEGSPVAEEAVRARPKLAAPIWQSWPPLVSAHTTGAVSSSDTLAHCHSRQYSLPGQEKGVTLSAHQERSLIVQ